MGTLNYMPLRICDDEHELLSLNFICHAVTSEAVTNSSYYCCQSNVQLSQVVKLLELLIFTRNTQCVENPLELFQILTVQK